jgi:hypothetical protein
MQVKILFVFHYKKIEAGSPTAMSLSAGTPKTLIC